MRESRGRNVPEGSHDGDGVALDGGTGVASALDLLAGGGQDVAVCSGGMLGVELEVGEVSSRDLSSFCICKLASVFESESVWMCELTSILQEVNTLERTCRSKSSSVEKR